MTTSGRELLSGFYSALARGDRPAVAAALHPGFEARFDPGLPHRLGGVRHGEDAIDRGWWAIGARYAMAAEPDDYLETPDGGLVVLGVYRGVVRETRAPVEADFVHVWTFTDGKLRSLRQYTDSGAWTP